MLIYAFAAPIFALMLYNELFWDGKKSKPDINNEIIERKERDKLIITILGLVLILPPIVMISLINYMNEPKENINPEIFELEMLPSMDEKYGESYLMIAMATFAAIISIASY